MPGPPTHRGRATREGGRVGRGRRGRSLTERGAPGAAADGAHRRARRRRASRQRSTTTTAAVNELLRRVAGRAIVLLRNEDTRAAARRGRSSRPVALVGPLASTASTQGGGSAGVLPPYEVSPLQGLQAALGDAVSIVTRARRDARPRRQPHRPEPVGRWAPRRVTSPAPTRRARRCSRRRRRARRFGGRRQFEPAGAGQDVVGAHRRHVHRRVRRAAHVQRAHRRPLPAVGRRRRVRRRVGHRRRAPHDRGQRRPQRRESRCR